MSDEIKKPKVLVTGGRGFIGKHLLPYLLERRCEVTLLLRSAADPRWLATLPELPRVVIGDLHDPSTLIEAVKRQDYVIHLAGLTQARTEIEYFDANVRGTQHLIDVVTKWNRTLKRFVHVSSLAVCGPSKDDTPTIESDSCEPLTRYGKSKLAGEIVARDAAERLPVIVLRPPIVYGPWEKGLFSFFKLAKFGVVPSFGRAQKRYSMIYAEDLVRALYLAMLSDLPSGSIYNVCDPTSYSWDQIMSAIGHQCAKRPLKLPLNHTLLKSVALGYDTVANVTRRSLPFGMDKYHEFAAPAWVASPEKAKRDLGFETAVTMHQGVRRTAAWYRQHGWL